MLVLHLTTVKHLSSMLLVVCKHLDRLYIYIYINLNRYVQCLILIEVNGIDSDEINAGVKLLKMFVFDTLRNAWRTDDAAFADAIESTSSCKETSRICNND